MAIERVVYGKLEDIAAEYSDRDSDGFFKAEGYKYVVHVVGDGIYDDEFCRTVADAKDCGRWHAKAHAVPLVRV